MALRRSSPLSSQFASDGGEETIKEDGDDIVVKPGTADEVRIAKDTKTAYKSKAERQRCPKTQDPPLPSAPPREGTRCCPCLSDCDAMQAGRGDFYTMHALWFFLKSRMVNPRRLQWLSPLLWLLTALFCCLAARERCQISRVPS